jgi:cytidylate kinase
MVIALDGPAGAGKSSAARAVAGELGFTYLDTGAMYRCVGLVASTASPGAEFGVQRAIEVARSIRIELGEQVRVDGTDVSAQIRTPAVSSAASKVAAIPEVRALMVQQQRRLLADGGNWVAEGRDIGTVVCPQAELKVFVTASVQERARRRAAESGEPYEAVLADQIERDARDMGRAHSPLAPADDAIELDTTGLAPSAVVAQIVSLARERS